jgi:hypothetical protein
MANFLYSLGWGWCGRGHGRQPAPTGDGSRCAECGQLLRLSRRSWSQAKGEVKGSANG